MLFPMTRKCQNAYFLRELSVWREPGLVTDDGSSQHKQEYGSREDFEP